MASIIIPSLPTPVDIGGIFGATDSGYKAGQDWQDERKGKAAFGQYLSSLYGNQKSPQAAPQTLASLAPSQQPQYGPGAVTSAPLPPQADLPTQRVASAFGDAPSPLNGYYAALRSAESSGNDAAANPNSSATGRYQFTKGTWDGLMTTHPELGLTPTGITDPSQQERAVRVLTAQNAKSLSAAGIPVNPGNLYAAHFLGAGGAGNVLTKPDNTPMSALVSPEVVQANPQLANMTVGDFKQWTAQKVGAAAPAAGAMPSQGVQVADASGGVPQMPAQNPASILPPPEVMQALFQSKETRPLAIGLAQSAIKLRANQNDPTAQVEYLTAVEKLKQLQNPDAQIPESVRALDIRARQAGLQPGTEEYKNFMISGGGKGINVNVETGTIPQGYQAVREANGRLIRYEPVPGGRPIRRRLTKTGRLTTRQSRMSLQQPTTRLGHLLEKRQPVSSGRERLCTNRPTRPSYAGRSKF